MGLAERLRELRDRARDIRETDAESETWWPQTADELYADFMSECESRARAGCSTILFHWDHHHTEDREAWERMKVIREEVVDRLRAEGLEHVSGAPEHFPEPIWDEFQQEWIVHTGRHYIKANWAR